METFIPKRIDEVYEELKLEIIWLHARWIIYRQLFAGSNKRADLLEACAAAFFQIIHNVLFWEVLASLSKLTDPANTGSFDNLSLEQLQSRLDQYGNHEIAGRTRPILDMLKSKSQPFRKWRNKRLAHFDLATLMKSGLDQLPGISRQMIENALGLIRQYMNQIEGYYRENEIAYENVVGFCSHPLKLALANETKEIDYVH